MESEKLNYKEAAKLLGVPVGTLYALVYRKAVPHLRLGKRLVRFSKEDLTRWLNAKKVDVKGSEQ